MIKQWSVIVLAVFLIGAAPVDRRYVVATAVNLREQPDVSTRVVVAIPIATEVKIRKIDGQWIQVIVENGEHRGILGWAASEFFVNERPSVEAMLKLADNPTLDYKIRLKWVERATALDRTYAEELRRSTIGQKNAERLYPFVDFNGIKKNGIYESDSGIVFQTTDGIMIIDPNTGKWTYGVLPNRKFSMQSKQFRLWESLGAGEIELPSWYRQGTYTSILSVDNITNPSWILTSLSGESAVCGQNDVIDVKRRIVYRLPCGYNSLLVRKRVVWLGSTRGVTAFNLDTLERTDYFTHPETRWIVDAFTTDTSIYYVSSIAGVYVIDRKKGAVRQLGTTDNKHSQPHGCADRVLHDQQLYCLRTSGNLSIFDLTSSKVINVNTGVKFADRLVVHNGVVYGYGRLEEWVEGGQRVGVYGGAFEYRIKDGTHRILLNEPVSYLRVKGDVAISIDEGLGGGTDIYHTLRGVHVSYKRLVVTRYKRTRSGLELIGPASPDPIFEVQGKLYKAVQNGMTEDRWPAPRYEFKELSPTDPSFETMMLVLEMREFEKKRSQERAARIKKIFSDLMVQPRTIAIPLGKVEVLHHPN